MDKNEEKNKVFDIIVDKAELLEIPTMVIVVQGIVGSGKTLLATYLGKYFNNEGLPAYSNYDIKGFESLDILLDLRKIIGAVVVIDDAVTEGLDSYQQLSKNSRLHTRLLGFVRKRRLVIVLTQQIESGIAKRIRHITNYIFEPSCIMFPYFDVKGYYRDGYMWLDTIIKFLPSVYEGFNTLQEVYSKISKKDILDTWIECDENKAIFKNFSAIRFGLNTDLLTLFADCVQVNNFSILKKSLNYYGYDLVD